MTDGELRRGAAVGDGGRTGMRGCLTYTADGLTRAVASPVFVPREDGPAVSWLLTEAALAPPARSRGKRPVVVIG